MKTMPSPDKQPPFGGITPAWLRREQETWVGRVLEVEGMIASLRGDLAKGGISKRDERLLRKALCGLERTRERMIFGAEWLGVNLPGREIRIGVVPPTAGKADEAA
jgi:hypothetical protein